MSKTATRQIMFQIGPGVTLLNISSKILKITWQTGEFGTQKKKKEEKYFWRQTFLGIVLIQINKPQSWIWTV
jgi:hypothetical protein